MVCGRAVTGILVTVLALAAGGCKKVVEDTVAAQNPYPASSPLHGPTDRMLRKMANDPRYLQMMGESAGDPKRIQGKMVELTMEGLPRLDDEALVQHMELVGEILDVSSDADCAQIAQSAGQDSAELGNAITRGLGGLPEDRIDTWFDLSMQASNATLDKRPVHPADQDSTDRMLARLLAGLPPDRQAAALTAMTEPAQASSDDLCRTSRLVYQQAKALPPAERAALARGLIDGL